jgi:hypothetical protein
MLRHLSLRRSVELSGFAAPVRGPGNAKLMRREGQAHGLVQSGTR